MNDLTDLLSRLRDQRPVDWDQLPDFSLYMDQVLSYMDRKVNRVDGDGGLTAAMVNNCPKSGLAPGRRARNTDGSTWRTSRSSAF